MKRFYSLLLFLVSVISVSLGQNLSVPDNYSIVDSITGDLDKDQIPELVVAFNTGQEDEMESIPRELVIYKLKNNQWIIWKKSKQALYGSMDGGMMGDPFGELIINKGVLHISQYGGSSWKWGHIDKYRFQNGEFYLIGYTSHSGKLCEYWIEVDYNLSTGKIIVEKEYEECENGTQKIYKRENETLFKMELKITLQNREEKEIKITTPKYLHEIYVSSGLTK